MLSVIAIVTPIDPKVADSGRGTEKPRSPLLSRKTWLS